MIEQHLPTLTPEPWVRSNNPMTPPDGANYVIPGKAGMVVTAGKSTEGRLLVSFSGIEPMTDEFCCEALGKFFPERKFVNQPTPSFARARYFIEIEAPVFKQSSFKN